ncbi:MAG: ASPIC/UnbV domain-containing protein, partial [Planctomycetota bacterium]
TLQSPPGKEEAWDRIFENQLVQDPAAADADKFHDLNPGPYTPTLEAGTPVRDLESRNPIPVDANQDGNMDLLVLPGTAHPNSTQFFQNSSVAAASNAKIGILLQNPGLCSMTTYFGVGANIRVQADLDGNGALDDGSQWAQVLIGEGNGATSTSPRIHFGLGKQDSQGGSPQALVQVTWPCGHVDFQNFDVDAGEFLSTTIQPGPHNHIAAGFEPASFTPPDTSGSPFLADGMAPIRATAYFADPVYHVELSARHASLTQGPFFPISMDHKKGGAGGFKLPLVPLLFPSDHDSMGMPLDETRYDIRVLAEGPFGSAKWLDSIGQPALQRVIKPELVEETDPDWKKGDGMTDAATENGALKIPAGETIQREYLFPGWTDFVDYDLVLRLKSDAMGGSLKVSASQMNGFETIISPIDNTSFQDFPVIATALPAAEFKTMIVLDNTGATVIFVDWVKRARHSNPLE